MISTRIHIISALFLMSLLQWQNTFAQRSSKDLSIHWRPSSAYNGKDNLQMSLVIKNTGAESFELQNWDLFFNSMYPALKASTNDYTLSDLRGNLFQVAFHRNLAPGDSLEVSYSSQYPISGISTVPNGFYLLSKKDKSSVLKIDDVIYHKITPSQQANRSYLENVYLKNTSLEKTAEDILIFPTPKYVKQLHGKFHVNRILKVNASDAEYRLFNRELSRFFVTQVDRTSNQADITLTQNTTLKKESYNLHISPDQVSLEYADFGGLLYGFKSLKSLYKGLQDKAFLPCLTVKDEPRYAYRGFMMDIARNFRDKKFVLKYLDLMADYKLNVFHLHFIEDEAWRLEIPGIPELTEVGATRSPWYHLGHSLQPAYGSGGDHLQQYLTRKDFIEILKYAKDRNIQVVPEIETPGHARAAIKSMEYRYRKYMKINNRQEAEKYLLHDFEDLSEYNTAQNFGDNIMNPALPSVYTFLDKVITEIAKMYEDADVPFTKVSLGGDEVPAGVWEKSPKIMELMKREGLSSVHQVWSYYIDKINQLCKSKGLALAGWEEIGMVNKGNGMVVNPQMADKQNMQLDVWNNIIGGGQDDLAYKLANAGYSTVLISASNTYFDMMWDSSFDEPGLSWATKADLYHSYSLFPEDYFANIHTYYSGKNLDKAYINKLTRLTEKGRANFLGIKGGIFAETVINDIDMDYLVFPRFFVLAERAWSPKRSYESESTYHKGKFDHDYRAFVHRIGHTELPYLDAKVSYRLPRVGLKLEDGRIKGNVEYPGFKAYYTLDGSTPSLESAVFDFSEGIAYQQGQEVNVAVIDMNGRIGPISSFK